MKTKILAAIMAATIAASASAADVVVQMGSFRNLKLAKTQVAEAALLGVKAHVVEEKNLYAQSGVQTHYRVRTAPMPHNQAENLAAKLRQNNMDVILFEVKKSTRAK